MLANYTLASTSPAIDYVPSNTTTHPVAATAIPSLATDFFGNPRPDPGNTKAFDIGAIELQATAAQVTPGLTAIAPASFVRGTTVTVVLTGANLASTSKVNLTGTGVTASSFTVTSSTSVSVTLVVAPGAALSPAAHTIGLTTVDGNTNTVQFAVTGATATFSAPTPVLTSSPATTTPKVGTITVSNAAAATGPLTLTAAPTITRTAGSGTFAITGGSCASGSQVNPGGSCTVIVQYTPPLTGNRTANSTAHITLTGSGLAAATLNSAAFNGN